MYVSFCSVRMLYDLLTLLVPLHFPNRIQHSYWLLLSINQFNQFVTADKLHYKSSKRPRYLERVYIQYISLGLRLWERCELHRCAAIWYDLYISPRSSLMIRQVESAFIVFGWEISVSGIWRSSKLPFRWMRTVLELYVPPFPYYCWSRTLAVSRYCVHFNSNAIER